MAGTTSRLGLPYPTGTDRVADGDNAIQALADALDFGGVRVGAAAIPFGTQVNAVRKATMQTAAFDAQTDPGGILAVTFPVPFTSMILHFSATLLVGGAYNPVIANGTMNLSGATLYFPDAASVIVKGSYLVIGI